MHRAQHVSVEAGSVPPLSYVLGVSMSCSEQCFVLGDERNIRRWREPVRTVTAPVYHVSESALVP